VAGYSAMDVIAAGVRQANSFDAKLVEKALRSLKLQTLVGSVQFDSSGDLEEQKVYVFQVKDGEFVQLPAE